VPDNPANRPHLTLKKGQRPTNRAFKVVMPTAIAEAIKMEKGEDIEWLIEDKNTLVLTRCNKLVLRKPGLN